MKTVVDDSILKLICPTSVELLTAKPTSDKHSIKMKQEYLAWVNVKDGQLPEKAGYHRRKVYNHLKALEYALANKVQLIALGEDDVARFKESYERVMKLSDAQLREQVIRGYEQHFKQVD